MFAEQTSHLKHRHLRFASKDFFEFGIGINHAFVLLVLQAVLFDVDPDFAHDFRAWQWIATDDGGQSCARFQRLHEGWIRCAFFRRCFFGNCFFSDHFLGNYFFGRCFFGNYFFRWSRFFSRYFFRWSRFFGYHFFRWSSFLRYYFFRWSSFLRWSFLCSCHDEFFLCIKLSALTSEQLPSLHDFSFR